MQLFRPLIAIAALAAPSLPLAQELPPLAVPGEYVVELEAGREAGRLESSGMEVLRRLPGTDLAVVSAPVFESFGAATVPARIAAIPGVTRVEPNFLYTIDQVTDADPMSGDLWALPAIRAEQGWAAQPGAPEIVVAVIDTGVFTGHEDLAANIWQNPGEVPGNGVDDDGNGFVDDLHGWDFGDDDASADPNPACTRVADMGLRGIGGHGTHVAGIVGAVGGNGLGATGVARQVRIMALKVVRSAADGGCGGGMPSDAILAAMDYAIANGADVISMSLSSPALSRLQQLRMEAAASADVVVATSASNYGMDLDPDAPHGVATRITGDDGETRTRGMSFAPRFPAAWDAPTQITVAATRAVEAGEPPAFVTSWSGGHWSHTVEGLVRTEDGGLDRSAMRFVEAPAESLPRGSNFGASRVHIAAPGAGILSTAAHAEDGVLTSAYARSSGTSMATPMVAGAAALLRAAFPDQSAAWIRARLIATATPSPSLAGRVRAGGQLDLHAALCAEGAPRALPGCDAGIGAGAPATAATGTGVLGGDGAQNIGDLLRP